MRKEKVMREILFRGKAIDGNWYYGVPLVFTEDYVCMTAPHTYNKKVETNTIGQFTGLTDKNGTKIFEGDIVMFGFSPCVVKYDLPNGRYMFYEKGVYLKNGFNVDTMKTKEIIGNIHDNPEMIKELTI